MRQLISFIKKEFIQFFRDPKMLALSIIVPLFQLIILGYAANLDVEDIPTLICDRDNTQVSREYVDSFTKTGYFDVKKRVHNIQNIDKYIDRGEVSFVLIVENGFERKIKKGASPEVAAIIDGSDSNTATIGLNFSSMINKDFVKKILKKRTSLMKNIKYGQIEPVVRIEYNQNLESRNFMVPGILGLLLLIITMVVTSLAIVKEKERGTLEQVMVTPIKGWQMILGKLIPFTIIGIIDIFLVIGATIFIFGIPLKGSLLLIFFLTLVYLISTLGLGLFVSTISQTQQQAMLTSVFFIITPMVFLSGFIFPISNMPKIVQWITYIFPLRYFLVIIRSIFLRGVGLKVLWDQILMLFGLGIIIFAVSNIRFTKRAD
ncbi:MAG: ABC transporter permease [Candidatus Mcinerneyibacterium aminivorans]|jgi:ABC-2 type transport system permease protein|uniref:Transport permease protein n=1 Tax=Candidatus Mcinerneyibacterium aminivorans TaxID=2703815 RepID=A0A5D0MAD2_9BACT|nr:MAG: ABC transporter permease [Candidatus Mcinerneyibacterium aminivorans]